MRLLADARPAMLGPVRNRLALVFPLLMAAGCVEDDGLPEGKLARVGPTVFGSEDVSGVRAQLGAYAQLRFRGPEGERNLLDALIDAELMALEIVEQGRGDDPRVRYAVLEEIASVYLSSELERRVPREETAADQAALRAWYDAHPEAFVRPERRSAQGVLFDTLSEAEDAHDAVSRGERTLEELGDLLTTPLLARDDHEFPSFHPFLFDPQVEVGELLAAPVVIGERILVARVDAIEPETREPFDDPAVQERLVREVRSPKLEAAREALLEELRARYPETPASP